MRIRYRPLKGPIDHHRAVSGLTYDQLAERIGVDRSTLIEQVNGKRPMTWTVAAGLAVALDVPPHVLVEPVHEEVSA